MRPIRLDSISLRHILKLAGFFCIITILLLYIHNQARNLLTGPKISLDAELQTVYHTRTIEVTGIAKNIVAIRLNGKEIYTDEEGRFAQSVVLENGYTIMVIGAEDRFGRSTTLSRAFVYVPAG